MPLTYEERKRRNLARYGTASGYRKSGEMRDNRMRALVAADFRCTICHQRRATQVHHIDGSKDNHALENLQAVCRKCHASLPRTTTTSKYLRQCGMTLMQMVELSGKSYGTVNRIMRDERRRADFLSSLGVKT